MATKPEYSSVRTRIQELREWILVLLGASRSPQRNSHKEFLECLKKLGVESGLEGLQWLECLVAWVRKLETK